MSGRWGRPIVALVVFALVVIALPLATPILNGLKPGGLPLGYASVSQGAPLLLALFVLLVPWTRPDGR